MRWMREEKEERVHGEGKKWKEEVERKGLRYRKDEGNETERE